MYSTVTVVRHSSQNQPNAQPRWCITERFTARAVFLLLQLFHQSIWLGRHQVTPLAKGVTWCVLIIARRRHHCWLGLIIMRLRCARTSWKASRHLVAAETNVLGIDPLQLLIHVAESQLCDMCELIIGLRTLPMPAIGHPVVPSGPSGNIVGMLSIPLRA
jgi:hypothetical protein